jgi:hypothetical protein
MSEIGSRFETFKEEIGKRWHPDAHKLRGLAVLESSCLPLDLRVDSAVSGSMLDYPYAVSKLF